MADMIKVKDFAKNFGLDIKDATKIIEDSGLLGSAQIGESVEISFRLRVVSSFEKFESVTPRAHTAPIFPTALPSSSEENSVL